MKRVVVSGNSGSGKSTFAVRLGDALGLPVIHMDRLSRNPDGTHVSDDGLIAALRTALAGGEWVCEGFNVRGMDVRLERADAAVLLDPPAWLCAWRLIRSRGARPGLPGRGERKWSRAYLGFLRWVLIYPTDRRPYLLAEMRELAGERLSVLRTRRDVERFISDAVRRSAAGGRIAGDPTDLPRGQGEE